MESKSNYLSRENNNFDLIRLSAALLVLLHHSSPIFYGHSLMWDPFHKLIGMDQLARVLTGSAGQVATP